MEMIFEISTLDHAAQCRVLGSGPGKLVGSNEDVPLLTPSVRAIKEIVQHFVADEFLGAFSQVTVELGCSLCV